MQSELIMDWLYTYPHRAGATARENTALLCLGATNTFFHALAERVLRALVFPRLDAAFADMQAAWAAFDCSGDRYRRSLFSTPEFAWPSSLPRPPPPALVFGRLTFPQTGPHPFTTVSLDRAFIARWAAVRWPGPCNEKVVDRLRHWARPNGTRHPLVESARPSKPTGHPPWRLAERHPLRHIVAYMGCHLFHESATVLALARAHGVTTDAGPLILLCAVLASAGTSMAWGPTYDEVDRIVIELLSEERTTVYRTRPAS